MDESELKAALERLSRHPDYSAIVRVIEDDHRKTLEQMRDEIDERKIRILQGQAQTCNKFSRLLGRFML